MLLTFIRHKANFIWNIRMSATALGQVKLTNDAIQQLVLKAREWALLQGVQMIPEDGLAGSSLACYAPITLFPSPVPRAALQEGKDLQREYNRLMHTVAHDHQFLKDTLENVIKVDKFTRMLWDIYCTVREEGRAQQLSLGLFRNDYMLDTKSAATGLSNGPVCTGAAVSLKQIEFNTIASSFGGLASGIWNVHRYTMTLAGVDFTEDQIPENQPSEGLARGLAKAWEAYGQKDAVILTVRMNQEKNLMDQKWLERKLFDQNRAIRVVYASLAESWGSTRLTDDKRIYLNNQEVAVIYFREGYSPDHYPSKKEVEVRLRMERSRAVKCPSVQCQLAGCKKVQQSLAVPGALERFVPDAQMCRRIRATFAGQYSLDKGEAGDSAVAMAMTSPENFVLKPQREGGGNNVYGAEICDHLSKMADSEERSAWVLMERIFPWPQRNHLLKEGKDWGLRDVVSEIGIYGVYLGSDKEEILNEEAGHLLRTKSNDDNEGGIVAGFATIDSPLLVDSVEAVENAQYLSEGQNNR